MSGLPSLPASSEVQARTGASVELMCLPGRDLTLAELFRALDVLRRRLARASRGREGAFAGFDALDISGWQEHEEDERVLFSARLVEDGPAAQVVAYEATRCVHACGACLQTGSGAAYVRASGTTVGLGHHETRRPHAARFSIASPHR